MSYLPDEAPAARVGAVEGRATGQRRMMGTSVTFPPPPNVSCKPVAALAWMSDITARQCSMDWRIKKEEERPLDMSCGRVTTNAALDITELNGKMGNRVLR